MFRKIAAISLLFALCLPAAVGRQKVAVYVTGNNNSSENKIIGSKLVAAITNDGYYEAVERTAAFLGQLQKEQQYQQSGNVADDQLSKLGRQFGVDLVCIAEVVPVARAFFISARLVSVETASVEATADVTCDNVRDIQALAASASELAEQLLNPDAAVSSVKPQAASKKVSKPAAAAVEEERMAPKKVYVSDYTGCGFEIQAKDAPNATWNSSSICPKGWRLPSRKELLCMCNRSGQIGNFVTDSRPYWSGEASSDKKAYGITFNDCEDEKENKEKSMRVRCVRD
ncbi:MAG: DUF1566 domain-containing protein [Prevotellaceae bacterium]|jgi:hypothetical protein|nr:DUF1566 domain-containing protein [Prevotellaceae bacterium]